MAKHKLFRNKLPETRHIATYRTASSVTPPSTCPCRILSRCAWWPGRPWRPLAPAGTGRRTARAGTPGRADVGRIQACTRCARGRLRKEREGGPDEDCVMIDCDESN